MFKHLYTLSDEQVVEKSGSMLGRPSFNQDPLLLKSDR